ncbi:MFS transporter [Petrotoga sp. HWH.PT.55.6.1]|uniref:MFS transporter n=1 Tax=unclassified Petrotoga TaxID=2620614 RepID=UPI0007494730|nr:MULTISPECIES: MFS transporter [unclassified Petrotoga]KUK16488.1 MAG: Major facilitator superfamily MFS_1 [Petrotoga mobilis]PNR94238.1 MFS transporter [Petrotoga sp. HWHPT.55.6.3]RPD36380.1 MFS transporter [Petrotoga sp. HWH.PT.55.6.1]HBT51405.1 MFS transporter [Petrotoga sp.]
MYSILLVIIYISFISLGLPDTLLGSAWPSMYETLNVPVSYAGIISMIISCGTIISTLFSGKSIRKLGTGKLTAISVGMTAIALFGFSISNTFWHLCLWGIPYGLGAGSVDAALNNFVALHYKARHMNWLHCFWGVGATLGPYIMGILLTNGFKWNSGYFTISLIQIALTLVLFFTLPLWKEKKTNNKSKEEEYKNYSLKDVVALPGAMSIMIAFFSYCALEATTGLWAASYLVLNRGIAAETAAKWAASFYFGITIGRFISGFITFKMNNKNMVRLGQGIIILGLLLLILPFINYTAFIGLILIGLGCAPIFPSLIHSTPTNFGKDVSHSIIGVQMASAYLGTTLMPPLFGFLQEYFDIRLYPIYLTILVFLMIVMVEKANGLFMRKQVRHSNP